jgi:hypothetical protein
MTLGDDDTGLLLSKELREAKCALEGHVLDFTDIDGNQRLNDTQVKCSRCHAVGLLRITFV